MKLTNGKIIIAIGIIHTLFTISPAIYGKQFFGFAQQFFFKINDGFLASGPVDYETFAAFWCFFFGILFFPLGILLDYVEKCGDKIPMPFIVSYLIVTLMGVYMIPLGGFTIFMLPHVIYLLIKSKRTI